MYQLTATGTDILYEPVTALDNFYFIVDFVLDPFRNFPEKRPASGAGIHCMVFILSNLFFCEHGKGRFGMAGLAMELLESHTYKEVADMTGISTATLARYKSKFIKPVDNF